MSRLFAEIRHFYLNLCRTNLASWPQRCGMMGLEHTRNISGAFCFFVLLKCLPWRSSFLLDYDIPLPFSSWILIFGNCSVWRWILLLFISNSWWYSNVSMMISENLVLFLVFLKKGEPSNDPNKQIFFKYSSSKVQRLFDQCAVASKPHFWINGDGQCFLLFFSFFHVVPPVACRQSCHGWFAARDSKWGCLGV